MTTEIFIEAVNDFSAVVGFATGIIFFTFIAKVIFTD